MKCLYLFGMLSRSRAFSCKRGIQTGAIALARGRAKNVPRYISHEPGLKYIEAASPENSDLLEEIENEEDLHEEVDPMFFDKAYDLDKLDESEQRERFGRFITIKKFFKEPRQPVTLTCNERECIKYLHKTDPVHWNVRTLSESFPATPEAIKKVLRSRYKIDPEKKKKIDLRVQKNWELLAEGKLKALPEVLEHLKKFTNRKEVLLEQIKKAEFYLPEVKEEVVWNNGEMNNILVHYEKAIQKLVQKQEAHDAEKLTGESQSSVSETKPREICPEKSENSDFLKNKFYSTIGRTKFDISNEKAMTKLNTEAEADHLSSPNRDFEEISHGKAKFVFSNKNKKNFNELNAVKVQDKLLSKRKENFKEETEYVVSSENGKAKGHVNIKFEANHLSTPNENFQERCDDTKFILSNELGKVLSEIEAGHLPPSNINFKESNAEDGKQKSVVFDTEQLRSEAEYFEKEVKDIENTAFWNSGSNSEERACTESKKVALGGPDSFARGNFISRDAYPERIKIPKSKRGSGLIFKVKDCYYDDDGSFLYRVPGMVK